MGRSRIDEERGREEEKEDGVGGEDVREGQHTQFQPRRAAIDWNL